MRTIHDVRRENVIKLINDQFDGVTNRLAKAVDVKHHVISRCLKPEADRSLGVNLVRKIESVCDLPTGSLDEADEEGIQYANKLAERLDQLRPEHRDRLLDLLEVFERQ